MSTYVLPLWDSSGSVSAPKKPTLDDFETLVSYIDSNSLVQQSLEINDCLGHGIWSTVMNDWVVVADFSGITWGDVLNRPSIDAQLQFEWGKWRPTEDDWMTMRKHIATMLAGYISKACGYPIDASRLRYTVRRKTSKGAKVFKCYLA